MPFLKSSPLRWRVLGLLALLCPLTGQAANTYSGQAIGVTIVVGGLSKNVGETGLLPHNGGKKEDKTWIEPTVPPVKVSVNALKLLTEGAGNKAASSADLSNVQVEIGGLLGVAPLSVGAATISASTDTSCPFSAKGAVNIVGLKINGKTTAVSGAPNQRIPVPGGEIVINERTGKPGTIAVNGLRIMLAGVADVIISRAESGIVCASEPMPPAKPPQPPEPPEEPKPPQPPTTEGQGQGEVVKVRPSEERKRPSSAQDRRPARTPQSSGSQGGETSGGSGEVMKVYPAGEEPK